MLLNFSFHLLNLLFTHGWDILHLGDAQGLALRFTPHVEAGINLKFISLL